jgi:hypothetical protein
MNLQTHILLATKLLDACGLPRGGAIYAVLPELDLKPAHFHRMFANILLYQPTIIDTALEIFALPQAQARDFGGLKKAVAPVIADLRAEYERQKADPTSQKFEVNAAFNRLYCYERITEDFEKFCHELDAAAELIEKFERENGRTGDAISKSLIHPSTHSPIHSDLRAIAVDKPTAAVALLSHTYFLTYTYPPMPFLPFSSMASQQIEFTNAIDYFEFKGIFVRDDHPELRRFQQALLDNPALASRHLDFSDESDPVVKARLAAADGKPYDPQAMVKAMIERLGALAPGIDYDAVQKGVRNYLSYLGCVRMVHSDRERRYLKRFESEILRTVRASWAK